ncbi:hypothetical protein IEE91_08060 [Kocuria sp. cx-455]|uniref:hypothetical protein n=1 Tax=unclassified Candidatus Sulfotelmatobacter TaxID=2635724 RepID=UPI0016858BEB|nr:MULTISPECIES: hypothetical protein [unclassified Candidatus Sulfotelmatobacter]MBD2762818.1 hypothetical protein [Kocuria sp. cx-116]MBD2765133.1 hypothetical protein [Kocuria sp. cx-455]
MKNIQQLRATTESSREQWVDVTVDIDPDHHVVRLTDSNGDVHEYLSGNVRALVHATAHNRGRAQWCEKYRQLLIPGASNVSGGVPFYKLEPKPVALSA